MNKFFRVVVPIVLVIFLLGVAVLAAMVVDEVSQSPVARPYGQDCEWYKVAPDFWNCRRVTSTSDGGLDGD